MLETSASKRILPWAAAGFFTLLLLVLAERRPYLFGESNLQGLLVLVIAAFLASQYRTRFWPLMIGVFFWAGSDVPLAGAMNMFRWVVLGLGALLGIAYYARWSNRIPFNYLHLLGLFTVLAIFASALVSVNPLMTVLKCLSVTALFFYASIGARLLWARNPEPFVRMLVPMAETLVYFTLVCYSASFEAWGNPNSLGLIMGCICWPVLLWRSLLPSNGTSSARRFIPLLLCAALLIHSLSRASMTAAFLSSMFLLIGARRYRTVLVGVSLLTAILLNVFLLMPDRFQNASDTLLYKKGEQGRLMSSRQKPWERSLSTFHQHPWLGIGFGVADNSSGWNLNYETLGFQTRERGSSYLTILETTGVVGSLPCAMLIFSLLLEIRRVFSWLRRTGNVNQPAVVASAIILGGLVNAVFEDWLLAVGYYMCVIFWVVALSLRDWMACPVWPDTVAGQTGRWQ